MGKDLLNGALSTGVGYGVTELTGNQELGMAAGVLSSFAFGKGLDDIDESLNISGLSRPKGLPKTANYADDFDLSKPHGNTSADVDIVKSKYFEQENMPRKVKQSDFSVDWDTVQSKEYSDNEKVSSAIETRAKWALNNRDTLKSEELYAINLDTGEEIARITDQFIDSGVERTPEFTKALDNADSTGSQILLLHNHPKELPPSISDINALIKNKNVSGITVGHDGSIYYYTRPNKVIPPDDFNVALRHFKGYTEVTNIEKALDLLSKKYGFSFEVL